MSNDTDPTPLHPWIDPELEARIVALVLGEASDFEHEELERQIAEDSDLAAYRKRIESVHGLVSELAGEAGGVSASAPDGGGETPWKLPAAVQEELLRKFESSDEIIATPAASAHGKSAPAGPVESIAVMSPGRDVAPSRHVRRNWRRSLSVAAAIVGAIVVLSLLTLPGIRSKLEFATSGESPAGYRIDAYDVAGDAAGADFGLEGEEMAATTSFAAPARGYAVSDDSIDGLVVNAAPSIPQSAPSTDSADLLAANVEQSNERARRALARFDSGVDTMWGGSAEIESRAKFADTLSDQLDRPIESAAQSPPMVGGQSGAARVPDANGRPDSLALHDSPFATSAPSPTNAPKPTAAPAMPEEEMLFGRDFDSDDQRPGGNQSRRGSAEHGGDASGPVTGERLADVEAESDEESGRFALSIGASDKPMDGESDGRGPSDDTTLSVVALEQAEARKSESEELVAAATERVGELREEMAQVTTGPAVDEAVVLDDVAKRTKQLPVVTGAVEMELQEVEELERLADRLDLAKSGPATADPQSARSGVTDDAPRQEAELAAFEGEPAEHGDSATKSSEKENQSAEAGGERRVLAEAGEAGSTISANGAVDASVGIDGGSISVAGGFAGSGASGLGGGGGGPAAPMSRSGLASVDQGLGDSQQQGQQDGKSENGDALLGDPFAPGASAPARNNVPDQMDLAGTIVVTESKDAVRGGTVRYREEQAGATSERFGDGEAADAAKEVSDDLKSVVANEAVQESQLGYEYAGKPTSSDSAMPAPGEVTDLSLASQLDRKPAEGEPAGPAPAPAPASPAPPAEPAAEGQAKLDHVTASFTAVNGTEADEYGFSWLLEQPGTGAAGNGRANAPASGATDKKQRELGTSTTTPQSEASMIAGRVNINGNYKTEDRVIRREILVDSDPGESSATRILKEEDPDIEFYRSAMAPELRAQQRGLSQGLANASNGEESFEIDLALQPEVVEFDGFLWMERDQPVAEDGDGMTTESDPTAWYDEASVVQAGDDFATNSRGFVTGTPEAEGYAGALWDREAASDEITRLGRTVQADLATPGKDAELDDYLPQTTSYYRQLAPIGVPVPSGLDETAAADEPFSTFSLHVSDVSFKLAQAALANGEWPEAERIRIEEFVNAFDYGDSLPSLSEKVACQMEQVVHPFLQQRNLLRVSMRTAAVGRSGATPLNLTLLLDNSGSMERQDREQTVLLAFARLAEQLQPSDSVTLIGFARQPRLLADHLPGSETRKLIETIANIPSEGGTNLDAAISLAAEKAREHQADGAQSRVILLTDGAANLGDADPERLSARIEALREQGIAFDAAGIGADGLNDEILEALTRKGDGRYYLLDRPEDADEGFARQIAGALRPAAKNVKVQIEFNPDRVTSYKLLGFEKHRLDKEDFRDDSVDAAEIAAEEAGVAVYQFEPRADGSGDVGTAFLRFRDMESGEMVEKSWPIPYIADPPRPEQASPKVRLATVASLFASRLRGEPLGQTVELSTLSQLLESLPAQLRDLERVVELRQMIEQARNLEAQ